MKVALVICGSLLCGIAAAEGTGDAKLERKARRQAMKQEMLQKFDANKNGTLDDAERTAMHDHMTLARFKQLDTDGNGVLSLAEFKAGKHKMGKRHARGGFGKRVRTQ